jgi:hypothetical protein
VDHGALPVIADGTGFIIRHASGRYFQSRMHFEHIKRIDGADSCCHDPNVPMAIIYNLVRNPFAADLVANRQFCGRFLGHPEWAATADQFEVVPGPGCGCCGERGGTMWGEEGHYRCDKHKARNPCAIEGCGCTVARNGHKASDDQYLCQKHWRPLTTTAERRVYFRIWREAKARERKYGVEHKWPDGESRRLERVWNRIVARARSRAAGDIDMEAIKREFGW